MTRVLIVDDSLYMRTVIAQILETAGETVVGSARNTQEAVSLAKHHDPEVVLLDLEMPKSDPTEALNALRAGPARTVVAMSEAPEITPAVLERFVQSGAYTVIRKPGGVSADGRAVAELVRTVREAAQGVAALEPRKGAGPRGIAKRLVIIASSAGGPHALTAVVPKIPESLPAAVIIVQHMPRGFTRALATRLNNLSALSVREAGGSDLLREGEVLVAAGGFHLLVERGPAGPIARLSDAPPKNNLRPCADYTFVSAAQVFGPAILGVVLTGMGEDGVVGLAALRKAGGRTLVNDARTAAIDGMPRAARERGLADEVVALPDMALRIADRTRELPARNHDVPPVPRP